MKVKNWLVSVNSPLHKNYGVKVHPLRQQRERRQKSGQGLRGFVNPTNLVSAENPYLYHLK